jgi:NAD(P)-dependent dehydrogenase (short-subunit alcohol dehydrogenase family)
MLDFKGQIVVVAGATGNLGAAIAGVLSRVGASLALADMNQQHLEALASRMEGAPPLLIAGADVRTQEGCASIVDQTLARFGRIDALANTVGAFKMANVTDGAARDWRALMELNALSALLLSEAALPTMVSQGYGRIVHVAAGAAQRSFAGAGVYAASKAALMRITEAVSEEHKMHGVTANCVLPGTIDTPQNRAAMADADWDAWLKPDEVAAVVTFLLSRHANAVTGIGMAITGKQ